MKIRVLIIDDSAVVRETMTQILSSDPDIEVMGTASDPLFAIKKIQAERPDVITLDVEMPRMDGLSFLKKINSLAHPIPVVICSSKVEAGSDNAFKALEYGAAELILKPKMGTKVFLQESQIRICDAVKSAYCSKNKIRMLHLFASRSVLDSIILPSSARNSQQQNRYHSVTTRSQIQQIFMYSPYTHIYSPSTAPETTSFPTPLSTPTTHFLHLFSPWNRNQIRTAGFSSSIDVVFRCSWCSFGCRFGVGI